eukprot:TRINITY_DN9360_c0_g1_i1.p1 TRINITY_DN9360_c0_g1~~TRINITY_DN9360_c0_g1_i1.p1  ORF type:complete len:462 (-),score=39.58 TRINITY_DN9360_c0_g1_i1:19-1350(-)
MSSASRRPRRNSVATPATTTYSTTSLPSSASRHHRLGPIPLARVPLLEAPEQGGLLSNGTVNFAVFCVALALASTLLDNYEQTGVVLELETLKWLLQGLDIALILFVFMVYWSFMSFFVTVSTIRGDIKLELGGVLYGFIQFGLFAIPTGVVVYWDCSQLIRAATAMQVCVYAMKVHSYWSTNWTLLEFVAAEESTETFESFSSQLTPNKFAYFMFAPTLVYEREYPMLTRIDWVKFAQLTFVFALVCLADYTLLVSYLFKYWGECQDVANISPFNFGRLLIRLSIPVMAHWMFLFFAIFHLGLGMSATLLRFADQEFYHDWWNADNFSTWWRKWNRPVHKWMLRHVFQEFRARSGKGGKPAATIVTFLVSAVLHEYIITLALGMFRPILSSIMMVQILLIRLTSLPIFKGTQFGNYVVWLTIFAGQPLVSLFYCWELNRTFG